MPQHKLIRSEYLSLCSDARTNALVEALLPPSGLSMGSVSPPTITIEAEDSASDRPGFHAIERFVRENAVPNVTAPEQRVRLP